MDFFFLCFLYLKPSSIQKRPTHFSGLQIINKEKYTLVNSLFHKNAHLMWTQIQTYTLKFKVCKSNNSHQHQHITYLQSEMSFISTSVVPPLLPLIILIILIISYILPTLPLPLPSWNQTVMWTLPENFPQVSPLYKTSGEFVSSPPRHS